MQQIYTNFQYWAYRDRAILMTSNGHGALIIDFITELDDALLWSLSVDPEFRDLGLGTALLEEAEYLCRGRAVKRIVLDWDERNSEKWVLHWYKRLGFTELQSNPYGVTLTKCL